MAYAPGLRFAFLMCVGWCFFASSPAAVSAVITTQHGDVMTNTIEYQNIVEASTAGLLFGTPFWEGDDSLVFKPTNFVAQTTLTDQSLIVDGQLRFTMDAKAGEFIPKLLLQEGGTYDLLGGPNDFALATVFVPLFFTILEINNTPVMGPMGMAEMVLMPSGGDFFLNPDGQRVNRPWSGSLLIDFDQIIANDANINTNYPLLANGHATRVEVTFNNTLSVYGSDPSSAMIRKSIVRVSVPELSSVSMAGIAGLLLAIAILSKNRFVSRTANGAPSER